ncbi:MAG: GAF domain-containing protein, partial [Thermoleophilia bacterium]|nr:GAF domain-containing protein [Thermoleophilia bacterium]
MSRVKKSFLELASVFSTRLGRKIALPILLVLALFTIPLFFAFRIEAAADQAQAKVENEDWATHTLHDMVINLRGEQIAVYEMIFERRASAIASYQTSYEIAQAKIDELSKNEERELATDPLEADEAPQIRELMDLQVKSHEVVSNRIIPAVQMPEPDITSIELAEIEVQQIYERMMDISADTNVSFEENRGVILLNQVESREWASEMMWGSIFLFVALGLGVAAYSTRKLVLPLQKVTEVSLQIARGDLSQRVEIKGRDELADFGSIFNDMADSLERQTSQLVNEKARIRSIHQSIGDGIIVVDRGGVIVSVNPAAERALGRTAKDLEWTTNIGIPDLQAVLTAKIVESEMVNCWEAKNCAKSDCPSHGSRDRRCWLQCGTFCYNQIQGTFREKRDACERCDVFLTNAVIRFEQEINGVSFSGQAVPILDNYGQEEGKTIVLHDVSDLRRAKEDAEQSAAQLAVLNGVSRAAAGSLELDTILDASLASMVGGTVADAGFIHTVASGSNEMILVATQGIEDSFRDLLAILPQGTGCPGHVIESGGSVLENNLDQLGAAARLAVDAGFHSYVGAPLKVNKEIVGVISLVAAESDAFTADDKQLLSMIGIKVGMAMDNAKLLEKTVEYADQERIKTQIAGTLASGFKIEESIDEVVDLMHGLVEFDRISIVIEAGNKQKVVTPSSNRPLGLTGKDNTLLSTNTAASWVALNQKPFITGDIEKDMRFDEQPLLVEEGMKSQLNMPLIVKGMSMGSLNLACIRTDVYDENNVRTLQPIVDQLALSLDNQRLFEDISRAKTEWETTFDSASEGIVMVSRDHIITRLNSTAAAMLGGKVEDLVGRRCSEVLHQTSDIPSSCLMRQACESSTTSRGEQETGDGSILEVVVDTVYDNQNSFIGAVHFLRD